MEKCKNGEMEKWRRNEEETKKKRRRNEEETKTIDLIYVKVKEWELQFNEKYDYVGRLLKPGEIKVSKIK